jgi:hypothetical protein
VKNDYQFFDFVCWLEVNKMEKTLKVGFALALATLAITLTVLAASSASLSAKAATPVAHTGQAAAQVASGQSRGGVAISDGCQDSAAQVTGIDPLTGATCFDITPLG